MILVQEDFIVLQADSILMLTTSLPKQIYFTHTLHPFTWLKSLKFPHSMQPLVSSPQFLVPSGQTLVPIPQSPVLVWPYLAQVGVGAGPGQYRHTVCCHNRPTCRGPLQVYYVFVYSPFIFQYFLNQWLKFVGTHPIRQQNFCQTYFFLHLN